MKITEYVNRSEMDFSHAKNISRVIDIYPDLYSDYSQDLRKALTRDLADSSQYVEAFRALTPFMNEARILNSLLKLTALMDKHQHEYLHKEDFQLVRDEINIRVSNLCN